MYLHICCILSWICLVRATSQNSVTRAMYNDISILMGEKEYPEVWWQERVDCYGMLSPNLNSIMEKAWEGMIEFWETRGQENDPWITCEQETRWFESNCTSQPGMGMAIWEPCNYASNLAYDRLVVEICTQHAWTFPAETVTKIAESFAILTFGSSFFHGSETELGKNQDVKSNDLMAYVIHQAAVENIPYDPIIHDLSYTPRELSGKDIVDVWLNMFENTPVEEWKHESEIFGILPSLPRSFAGIFGYVLSLVTDLETSISVGSAFLDLLGVSPEDKLFFLDDYLPLMTNVTENVSISLIEKTELLENAAGTVLKLLYAFVWQEETLDLGEAIFTPEENAFGAALLPHINAYGNNLTTWDLYLEDVQHGASYPGSAWCNDLIPHAKWHAQTAASLGDVAGQAYG